jgi:cyclophilin family peptidyl-prolyl cis-trans isomerase
MPLPISIMVLYHIVPLLTYPLRRNHCARVSTHADDPQVHNSNLDYFTPGESKHPVFGQVVAGMDVVTKIEQTRTDPNDCPITPVMMKSVTIAM